MAGHNKWSKIKHKKAREDKKKGKVFTRLGREIQVAAREGGDDPQYNAALRQAVDRAMAENMPNDNIQRAIQRGTGQLPGQEIEDMMYEGYGPGGVAVLVACLSDNRNRTVSEVRHAFSKAGGSLGENGSVAWMFNRLGLVTVAAEGRDEEALMELAIEAGAQDIRPGDEDGVWEFVCTDTDLHQVSGALDGAGVRVSDQCLAYEPTTTMSVADEDIAAVMTFIDALDALDDVQDIYSNFDVTDAQLQQLSASM